MLRKILSISGRPGLYKLVDYGKNLLIVETMADGKRFPVHARDRVMSLGDISIFTEADDVPLAQVFETIAQKNENKQLDAKSLSTPQQMHEFFGDVLPNYDRDRVHNSDIKKVIQWYNILIGAGITDFSLKDEEEKAEEEKADEAPAETKQEDKPAEKE